MTRKSKFITFTTALTLLGVTTAVVISYSNSASLGTVQNQSSLNRVKSASISLKEQRTDYYTISVSDELYQKSAVVDEDRPIYAQYMYTPSEFGSDLQLSISLGRLSTSALDDISFVKQRRRDTDKYVVVSESPAKIVFRNLDNTEYGIFWLDGNRYSAIVGSGRSDNFQKIKDTVVQAEQSWQWRK